MGFFLSSVVKVHPWFGVIQTHFEGAALYAFSQAELLLRESVSLRTATALRQTTIRWSIACRLHPKMQV